MVEGSIFAFAGAALAAGASIVAAYISYRGAKDTRKLEAQLRESREATQFVGDKLRNLYVPISMHLTVTDALFERYFEASQKEKTAIEHELQYHNAEIRNRLLEYSEYLEPPSRDDPVNINELTTELLEHLIQWETVYELKYEYEVYDGPVFAGIDKFGWRGFPDGVDEYFTDTTQRLRRELHQQLSDQDRVFVSDDRQTGRDQGVQTGNSEDSSGK